jgi:hypothetical protein
MDPFSFASSEALPTTLPLSIRMYAPQPPFDPRRAVIWLCSSQLETCSTPSIILSFKGAADYFLNIELASKENKLRFHSQRLLNGQICATSARI